MQENQPIINNVHEPTAPSVTPAQPIYDKPKVNNFLVILLSILLLMSCFVAGFFAYRTQMLVAELQMKNESYVKTEEVYQDDLVVTTLDTDMTADWKTYSSPEVVDFLTPFTLKYPSNWNLKEERIGDLDELTVVLSSQSGDTLWIRQGAGGGGTCVYHDDKDYLNFEGQAGYYTSYVQVLADKTDWRLSKNKDISSTSTHTVCEIDTKYGRYISTTRVGDIVLNLKSESLVDEVEQILGTVVFKPTSKTKTLFD